MLKNVEFYCQVYKRFMQSWGDVEDHPHELTFRQKKIIATSNISETKCSICNKECQNSRNLEVHQRFKHPPSQYQDADDSLHTSSSPKQQQPTEEQQYDDDIEERQQRQTQNGEQQQQYDVSIDSPPVQQYDDLKREEGEQQQQQYE